MLTGKPANPQLTTRARGVRLTARTFQMGDPMAIDPMMYQKMSGKRADAWQHSLAKSAKYEGPKTPLTRAAGRQTVGLIVFGTIAIVVIALMAILR